MQTTLCPWCHSVGLHTTLAATPNGLVVNSLCNVCHSNSDSVYNLSEVQAGKAESLAFIQAGHRNITSLLLEMLLQ
jgi:hypothetical protein